MATAITDLYADKTLVTAGGSGDSGCRYRICDSDSVAGTWLAGVCGDL